MIKFKDNILKQNKQIESYNSVLQKIEQKRLKDISQQQFNQFFQYIFENVINIGSAEILFDNNSKSRISMFNNMYYMIFDGVQINNLKLKTNIITIQNMDINIQMFINCKINNSTFNDFNIILFQSCKSLTNCTFSNISQMTISNSTISSCKFLKIKKYNFQYNPNINNSTFFVQGEQTFNDVETSNFYNCNITNKNRSKKTKIISENKVKYYKCYFKNVEPIGTECEQCKFDECEINIGQYKQSIFKECKFDTDLAGAVFLNSPIFSDCQFFVECIIQGDYIVVDGKRIDSPQDRIIPQYRLSDYGVMLDDSVNQWLHRNNG